MEKYAAFERMLDFPQGFRQRFGRWAFYISISPIYLIRNVFPISLGGDYGRIWHIKKAQGPRKAVEFGCERLEFSIKKLNKAWFPFSSLKEASYKSIWILLSRTVEYANLDPQLEDEIAFNDFIEKLGIETIGNEASTTFAGMARLTWVLRKPEDSWDWVERAVQADKDNFDAHYLEGWIGALLEKGNPVESFFRAITLDPELLRSLRKDETMLNFPDFIAAVDARAKHAEIIVI